VFPFEGCGLDVNKRGEGISKIQFLIRKRSLKNFKLCFSQFLAIKTLHPDSIEMLDPDLDPDSMNLDPQH
jgi:hypothetical protein